PSPPTMPRSPRPAAPSPQSRAAHPADSEIAACPPTSLLENPLLGRPAQLLQTLPAPPLGINPHHRSPMPTPLPRIRPRLSSELLLHLGRQAEVLPLRNVGTNLVT